MKSSFRHIVMLLFAGLLATPQAFAQEGHAQEVRRQIESGDKSTIIVGSHRGDWRYAPENSIAAMERSIAIGADLVEIDVQLTSDSVPIVMHDETLDRTTNGKGLVSQHTLAEIKQLQLRNGCGIVTKHKVPTLEELLLATKGKVMVNLDGATPYYRLIIPILKRTGTASEVIFKSERPAKEIMKQYGDLLQDAIYMPMVNLSREGAENELHDALQILKPVIVELKYATHQETLPLKAREEIGNKTIWYSTLWDTLCGGHDDEMALTQPDEAYGYVINTLGASVILTDRTQLLLDYLREKGLHR